MKRRPMLVIVGLILAAFAMGLWMGSRFSGRTVRSGIYPSPLQPSIASVTPARASVTSAVGNPPPCVDFRNAGPLLGKKGCVTGVVLRAYTARSGNTFLDFCQDYRTCPFTSLIFAADKDKFGDPGSMQGKRVEIRGDVVSYQGHTEIVIHDPQQVRGGH